MKQILSNLFAVSSYLVCLRLAQFPYLKLSLVVTGVSYFVTFQLKCPVTEGNLSSVQLVLQFCCLRHTLKVILSFCTAHPTAHNIIITGWGLGTGPFDPVDL